MRIPHNLLNCVCFLGINLWQGKHAGKFVSLGTGFFVGVKQDGIDFLYLVTAKHVLDEVERMGIKHLQIRLNKHNGEFDFIQLVPNEYWVTVDEADLAVLGLQVDPAVFNFAALPLDMLATDGKLSDHAIGLGDDLFTVGLFVLRTGTRRNIPIIRTGVIAAMPESTEPLTKDGQPYHAYLAEMRSIGGLSGSPVFVFIDQRRIVDSNIPHGHNWMYFCVGLIRGHWDLKRDIDDAVVSPDVRPGYSKGENLNTGIALVTPSQYVVALLTSWEFIEHRSELVKMLKKKDEPTEDSAGIEDATSTGNVFAGAR
jgi:hypothetical protein